jgi:hypothetical protein
VSFKDAAGTKTRFGIAQPESCHLQGCSYSKDILIPPDAALGAGVVRMHATTGAGRTTFMVTASAAVPLTTSLRVRPHSGPPGTRVALKGSGFTPDVHCGSAVVLLFIDSAQTIVRVGTIGADDDGAFFVHRRVPAHAAPGNGAFVAVKVVWRQTPVGTYSCGPGYRASAAFKVLE